MDDAPRSCRARGALRVAATLLLAACFVVCGCAAFRGPKVKANLERDLDTVVPGTLTVACDFGSPPMNFVDGKGRFRGFEYELVGEIAHRLDLRVEYVDCDTFPAVAEAVASRTADMAASSVSLEDFDVTFGDLVAGTPYMTVGRDIIVSKERDFNSLDQLDHPSVSVVVQAGSPNETWVRENLPDAQVVPIDEAGEGLTAVANGTYTAAVYDDVTANYLINSVYTTLTVVYHEPDVSRFCFAFSDADPALRETVDETLAALEQDGYVDSLEAKWFGTVLEESS